MINDKECSKVPGTMEKKDRGSKVWELGAQAARESHRAGDRGTLRLLHLEGAGRVHHTSV